MLKYTGYDIVFREIPDEVTLAINLSNCPHRCAGCHSPYLQHDVGEELSETTLCRLLGRYEKSVTCVCFMGGDADTDSVYRLASLVREKWEGRIKTAWYSGRITINSITFAACFDFIKLGPYIESLGGLDKKTTNQRLYRIEAGQWSDITARLQ